MYQTTEPVPSNASKNNTKRPLKKLPVPNFVHRKYNLTNKSQMRKLEYFYHEFIFL